jgi:hypothetical protein
MKKKIAKIRKKKIGKVIVAQVPKPEATTVENVIGALTSLEASQGWAIVVKILNDNISYLEKAIIEKIDPDTKLALTNEEVEILRIKRSLNIDLRETPKNYTRVVNDTGDVPEEFDPYFKTNDEIIKAQMRPPKDDGR